MISLVEGVAQHHLGTFGSALANSAMQCGASIESVWVKGGVQDQQRAVGLVLDLASLPLQKHYFRCLELHSAEDVGACWRLKAVLLLLLQDHVVPGFKVGFWVIRATSPHQLIAFTVALLGDGKVVEGQGHHPPKELSPLTKENLELGSGSIQI